MSWVGILIVIVVAGGLFGLGGILYVCAFHSRKQYRCPQCGERLQTEYLNASRCGMCGAALEQEKYL